MLKSSGSFERGNNVHIRKWAIRQRAVRFGGSPEDDRPLNPMPVTPEAEGQPVTAGATPTYSPSGVTLEGGVIEVAQMPVGSGNEAALIHANQRRRINPAIYETPLGTPATLLANATVEGTPPAQPAFLGQAILGQAVLGGGIMGVTVEDRRAKLLADLRTLIPNLERALADFHNALAEEQDQDRFSIGGNNPPEPMRATVVEMMLAAKVVRLQTEEVAEPSWPVFELALSVLKRGWQRLSAWIADMWGKFSTAAVVAAGTAVGTAAGLALAKQVGLEISAVIDLLESLLKLAG